MKALTDDEDRKACSMWGLESNPIHGFPFWTNLLFGHDIRVKITLQCTPILVTLDMTTRAVRINMTDRSPFAKEVASCATASPFILILPCVRFNRKVQVWEGRVIPLQHLKPSLIYLSWLWKYRVVSTSQGRCRFAICSIWLSSGLNPPCMQIILSSMTAQHGSVLKVLQNCFHILTENLRRHSS